MTGLMGSPQPSIGDILQLLVTRPQRHPTFALRGQEAFEPHNTGKICLVEMLLKTKSDVCYP